MMPPEFDKLGRWMIYLIIIATVSVIASITLLVLWSRG